MAKVSVAQKRRPVCDPRWKLVRSCVPLRVVPPQPAQPAILKEAA